MPIPKDPIRAAELKLEQRVFGLLLVALNAAFSSDAREKIRQANLVRRANPEYRSRVLDSMARARPLINRAPDTQERKLQRKKVALASLDKKRENGFGTKEGAKFSVEHRQNLSKALRAYYGTLDSRPLGPDKDSRWCWEYEKWMKAVKKRDCSTCKHCGELKSYLLVAHHIKSYNMFPDLRYVVENGITLCRSCHGKEHARLNGGPALLAKRNRSPTMKSLLATLVLAAVAFAQGPPYPYNVPLTFNTETAATGYNMYRASYTTTCGSFTKLNTTPFTSSPYTDANPPQGAYCYAITAIGTINGVATESGLSTPLTNIVIPPPPPTGLGATVAKNSTKVEFIWAQSTGKGITKNELWCRPTTTSLWQGRWESSSPAISAIFAMQKGTHICAVTAFAGSVNSGPSNQVVVTVN